MLIPVVDANDIQIGLKEREDITSGDIYRVSALWLTNSNGDVLLTQRSYTKKNSPGAWSAASRALNAPSAPSRAASTCQ